MFVISLKYSLVMNVLLLMHVSVSLNDVWMLLVASFHSTMSFISYREYVISSLCGCFL